MASSPQQSFGACHFSMCSSSKNILLRLISIAMRNTHGVSQCLNRKSRASNNQSFHSFPTKRIGRTRSQWLHSRFMFCLINAQTSLHKRSNVRMCKRNPGSMWITCYPHVGGCKNPEPFQMVFPALSFFSLLSFFQALASHLDQRIHMSEDREKEKE